MIEEKNDEQILLRIPSKLKEQVESASKLEGMSSQDWIRKIIRNRISLTNVCPECGKINSSDAKFCNECGSSLKESKRSQFVMWMEDSISEMTEYPKEEIVEMLIDRLNNSFEAQEGMSKKGKTFTRIN